MKIIWKLAHSLNMGRKGTPPPYFSLGGLVPAPFFLRHSYKPELILPPAPAPIPDLVACSHVAAFEVGTSRLTGVILLQSGAGVDATFLTIFMIHHIHHIQSSEEFIIDRKIFPKLFPVRATYS